MNLWFPIDTLLVSQVAHDGYGTSYGLQKHLEHHPAIRSYGVTSSFEKVDNKINTIFVAPCAEGEIWKDVENFISNVRKKYPDIAFVIYAGKDCRNVFVEKYPKFKDYFYLEEIYADQSDGDVLSKEKELNNALILCDGWHRTRFTYDIGISFAGEDRKVASEIADGLKTYGNKVFYDEFEEENLLGKNLYTHLHEVYSERCRYCAIISSEAYALKIWTNHERTAAQERALNEKGQEYILPIKLDDTKIPGLFGTIGYLSIEKGIEKIVQIINKKLWVDGTQQKTFVKRSLY